MKIKQHFFGQDDASKELYRLVILVKPENSETDKNYIKDKLSDFQYEYLQDGYIWMVRRWGQKSNHPQRFNASNS